jgi:hypothetical protein
MISLNTRPTQERLKCKPTSFLLFNTSKFYIPVSAYFAPESSSFRHQARLLHEFFTSPSSSVCPTYRTSHRPFSRGWQTPQLAIIGNNSCPPNGTVPKGSPQPPQPCQAVDPSPQLLVLTCLVCPTSNNLIARIYSPSFFSPSFLGGRPRESHKRHNA